jgi:hypothetical protein
MNQTLNEYLVELNGGEPFSVNIDKVNEEFDRAYEKSGYAHPLTVDEVLTERGKRYGLFKDHANVTQQLKGVMFGFNPSLRLENDQKEALEMIAHKIGRIINGDPDYADSWVDIAGYAKLVADRLEGNSR